MALTKGLLLKGLAGLTVCGGATGGTLVATGVIGGGGGNGSELPPSPDEVQSEDGVNANGSRDTDPNLAPAQPPSRDGAVQQTDKHDNTHQVTQTDGSDSPGKQKGQESNGKSKEGSENPTNPASNNASQGGQASDQNNAHQGSQISGQSSPSSTTTGEGQATEGQQVNQDNGSGGSSVAPPTQGTADNSLGGGGSADSSRENATDDVQKSQGDRTDDSTGEHETPQQVSKDSQLGSSGSSNSSPAPGAPEAGQPAVDNAGLTTPGTSDVPGTGGATGSTPTSELGAESGNGASGGGSGSSDISTTDQTTQPQSKEAKINAKLKTLNIPDSCNFETGNTSKTCQISEKELKKIKFEESDNDEEDGASGSEEKKIQLKIEIPSENKKTAYGLNDSEDESNLLFTLSGIKNQIEVVEDNLTIYPNTNPEFKIEDGALKWIWSTFSDFAKKVGLKADSSKGSNAYTFDDERSDKTLKYSLDGAEGSIKTLNTPTTSGTIDVTDNEDGYNQGVKVTFREKVTSSGGSDSLEKGDYEIKYKDGNDGGWYLSKVTKPAGGGES